MRNCLHNNLKLPKAVDLDMVRCVKVTMSNEESYTVKVDDLVAIQFVKNDQQILVRRGRIKDLVVINRRELSTKTDNVSHIILDCSEQFTVKLIEIKFSDVIKIGGIDDEFEDYSDRITQLEPGHLKDCKADGCKIPVREHGFHTKEECPVNKCEPKHCVDNSNNVTKPVVTPRGFAITK